MAPGSVPLFVNISKAGARARNKTGLCDQFRCHSLTVLPVSTMEMICTEGSRELHAHLVPLRSVGGQLADESFVDADQYVLRFDVRVNDPALGVQIVQALQDLPTIKLPDEQMAKRKKKGKTKKKKPGG